MLYFSDRNRATSEPTMVLTEYAEGYCRVTFLLAGP